jgi:uncharacterized repeat protein (TIGR01451 family)
MAATVRPIFVSTVTLLLLAVSAPGASAQPPPDGIGSDRFVTIAARECPTYEDITANRARNDIQESLRDLGPDTPYVQYQPINPAIEAESQPNCTPLPDWRFTLGQGYLTRAVSGPWGSLSIVTNPYDTSIVTQPSTALLDHHGRPTADSLAGAVTIELTQAQAQRAERNNSLWIQGGTPTDPILNELFPEEFGFGALRCAIDNLNGDNVEWIAYPSGTEHVFCFAYYVRPPPTSGTIIIRKEVSDPPGADQSFQFDGNLSFNEGGRFDLNVVNGNPASQTFYRAETTGDVPPWTVREIVPPGWTLTDLSCESPGPSTETIVGASVSINLAAGDRVTCTFTNAFRVPAGRLVLAKVTRGGTGIFDFDVFPVGGGDRLQARAETQRAGSPVLARPFPLEVSPGLYRIREELPESRRGTWRLSRVWCAGREVTEPDLDDVVVRVRDQQGSGCLFENRFIPKGRLVIDKVTAGGVGRFDFTISPRGNPDRVYHQSATTTEPLTPIRARGDSTRRLELGSYVIQEVEEHSGDGEWALRLVVCDGRVVPHTEGRVIVRLTQRNPVKRCGFLNVFTPDDPDPPDPPGPGPRPPEPDPPGPNPAPHRPDPDLVVTKRANRAVGIAGERVTYTVTVRNRGPVAAEHVFLGEAPEAGQAFASVSGSGSNRCGRRTVLGRKAVICRMGHLAPGASRTLRFVARLTSSDGGVIDNIAVVGSSTPERTARNNVATARVRVRGRAGPPAVTGSL